MLVLPDDVLYLIFAYLDTAKDILSLLLTNHRLKTAIQADHNEGWRIFVRTRFPHMTHLPTSAFRWDQLADSLTWQTRAWDRRSVYFQAMLPTNPQEAGRRRGSRAPHLGRMHQRTAFHPVVDAHGDLAAMEDLVVWGAGENIVARRRKGRQAKWTPKKTKWHQVDGTTMGYKAGYDDITALSIVEDVCGKVGDLGMLVGRDNGHLAFVSATEDDFGKTLADLSPRHSEDVPFGLTQENINGVDILHSQGRVAVAAKSALLLYDLPEHPSSPANIAPSSFLRFASQNSGDSTPESIGGAKWMGEDTLALGLSGASNALRYIKVTPAGFSGVPISVRNPALEERFSLDPVKSRLCTSSLTPIDASSIMGGGGSNLLLSAWRDGTVRLQDLRTPTPLDLVYCDNIDPYAEFEALLAFGTSHFIGGGSNGATIKVFDLRWPRNYYHTAALPCGADSPVPRPHQPFLSPPKKQDPGAHCSRCAPLAGRKCRWHALSETIYHRPNGTFFFSKSLPRADAYASVWSLARPASLLAPNFYIGISGGVVEASLAVLPSSLHSSSTREMDVDPNFGYVPAVPRDFADSPGPYHVYDLDASLMETGDGRLDRGHERNVRMPVMRGKGWGRMGQLAASGGVKVQKGGTGGENGNGSAVPPPERLVKRHRLDVRFHTLRDYELAEA
ncbi:unnamed protein product [Discula destructiva]